MGQTAKFKDLPIYPARFTLRVEYEGKQTVKQKTQRVRFCAAQAYEERHTLQQGDGVALECLGGRTKHI